MGYIILTTYNNMFRYNMRKRVFWGEICVFREKTENWKYRRTRLL